MHAGHPQYKCPRTALPRALRGINLLVRSADGRHGGSSGRRDETPEPTGRNSLLVTLGSRHAGAVPCGRRHALPAGTALNVARTGASPALAEPTVAVGIAAATRAQCLSGDALHRQEYRRQPIGRVVLRREYAPGSGRSRCEKRPDPCADGGPVAPTHDTETAVQSQSSFAVRCQAGGANDDEIPR